MPQKKSLKPLGPEGTISFKLTPIQNNKDRLYLIDIGADRKRDRITLVVTKNEGNPRTLLLEVYSFDSIFLNKSEAFSEFQIGSSIDIELVWSTNKHKVAVFVNNKQFLEIESPKIQFNNMGNIIYYGEDIEGKNKTEMTAE